MSTTIQRSSLQFSASLEQAYRDLQVIHDTLDRQDGDVLQLVERIHSVEARVSDLVTSLDGTIGDLREEKKSKMVLLSSILEENAALAERVGGKPDDSRQKRL